MIDSKNVKNVIGKAFLFFFSLPFIIFIDSNHDFVAKQKICQQKSEKKTAPRLKQQNE